MDRTSTEYERDLYERERREVLMHAVTRRRLELTAAERALAEAKRQAIYGGLTPEEVRFAERLGER